MANLLGAVADYYSGGAYSAALGGSGGAGGGGGTSSIFTPSVGPVTATNQGISFGQSASQSVASSLVPVAMIAAVALVGVALLRR